MARRGGGNSYVSDCLPPQHTLSKVPATMRPVLFLNNKTRLIIVSVIRQEEKLPAPHTPGRATESY